MRLFELVHYDCAEGPAQLDPVSPLIMGPLVSLMARLFQ